MTVASSAEKQDQSVLRLRLDTLKRNLRQVEATELSVAQRRDEIDALAKVFDDQLDGIHLTGRYLVQDLTGCRSVVDSLMKAAETVPGAVRRLDGLLSTCAEYANQIEGKATDCAEIVQTMARRWETLTADEKFDEHIRQVFAQRAKALIDKIDELADVEPAQAWTTFQEHIRAESEDLFAEYVEFLGGLALRDTGLGVPAVGSPAPVEAFGADVYVMADDLIRQIYRIGGDELWHSLTIPARRDAAACTRARMIRLAFPEWTVWAVPLAAHEFGRVVIDKNEIVDAHADEFGGVCQGLKTLLADIFGTYAMGPSYALATVYVRLDPRTRNEQERLAQLADGPVRSDSERAYVVFTTLERMDDDGSLAKVTGMLRTRWEMAIDQAQGIPLPTGKAAANLDRYVAFLLDFLLKKAPVIKYSADRWAKTQQLDEFRALVAAGWRPMPGREDVRDVLNAAWRQRITAGKTAGVDGDVQLADDALELWRRDHAHRQRPRQRLWGH